MTVNGIRYEKGTDGAKAARCKRQPRDNQCGLCNYCQNMKDR